MSSNKVWPTDPDTVSTGSQPVVFPLNYSHHNLFGQFVSVKPAIGFEPMIFWVETRRFLRAKLCGQSVMRRSLPPRSIRQLGYSQRSLPMLNPDKFICFQIYLLPNLFGTVCFCTPLERIELSIPSLEDSVPASTGKGINAQTRT